MRKENKIHKIYRITNLITKRVYIGQTIKPIHLRWSNHKSPKSNCGYIGRSIKKYGPENFKIEWIASAISEEHIDSLEDEFIRNENTISPNGYNLKYGGSHPVTSDDHKKIMSKAQKKRYEGKSEEYRQHSSRGLREYVEARKVKLIAVNPKNGLIVKYTSITQAVDDGHSNTSIYRSLKPDQLGTSHDFHFFHIGEYTIDKMFELAEKQNRDIKQSHLDGRKKAVANMQDHINSQKVPYIGINPKTLEYKIFESSSEAVRNGYNTDAMRRGARGEKRTSKKLHFQHLTGPIEYHIEITKEIFKK